MVRKRPLLTWLLFLCQQASVVVVFVVDVVVVEVVVLGCSVKMIVAVWTSTCVTTTVSVVGFLRCFGVLCSKRRRC